MCHNPLTKAAIAVGSNVASIYGCPQASVQHAMTVIDADHTRVLAKSALYSTPCMPKGAGPDFVNAALIVETRLSPHLLLAHLHDIETRFERLRNVRWGPRTMDLDLLGMENLICPELTTWRHWAVLPPEQRGILAPDQLILPHPRLQERGFVLVPLAEIAPDWRHPGFDRTAQELLEALPQDERDGPRRLQ